jgi:hypothetical protein
MHRPPRSMRPGLAGLLAGLAAGLIGLGAPEGVVAQSQTTSAIRGLVVDQEDQPVAGALVTVRHDLTGTERSVITDAEGRFLVLLLPPGGPYTVAARSLGFQEAVAGGITLQVGRTHETRLALVREALEIPGIEARVERVTIFHPSQVGPAMLIGERSVQATPLASRDLMELTALSPLVRSTADGGFSVAGQNDRYNSILVDGLVNQDAFGLTAGGVPGGQAGAKLLPLDAVAQYEVLVSPYDASLSGFAGGVMNAVTRTGTNDWDLRVSAVARTESLMGDLTLPAGEAEAAGIERQLLAVSGGGPIIRDRAHFFIAGEFERRERTPTGFNLGRDRSELVGILPEAVEVFRGFFGQTHGVDAGLADAYPLEQGLANLFARVDWTLGEGRRLSVRTVFADARNDESPNRAPFEPYELSSNAVERASSNLTSSVQYFHDLAPRIGNELSLTFQRTTDRTTPVEAWPQVEAVLVSPDGSITPTRPVRAGAQFFAQRNDLAQTTIRLSNTLTLDRGRHTWSVGAVGSWYDIRHTYLPGATGDWYFPSWLDVLNNAPQRYQRTRLLDGQDEAVRFNVLEVGAFLQDQIRLGGGFTVRAGVRVESPFLMDSPPENERVRAFFGRSTAEPPSGMLLISPRLGINWQGGGRLRTQLRAGAGLFTGQLPHVWLSNAFHNTGLRSLTEVCTGRWTDDPLTGNTAPPFSAAMVPEGCLFGEPTEIRAVTLFDDDFRYPQYAKLSASLDQEITPALSGTVGLIFTHALNQVLLRELNISPQTEVDVPLGGYGGTSRTLFGVGTDDGFYPIRLLPGYDQVLLATNGRGDRSWSLSMELRGELPRALTVLAGYAYTRSYDRQSLTSVDLISNFGFTPTRKDPNDPPLTPSNFDRPHKVVLSVFGAPIPRLDRTEVALLYTGESGYPFSYVYRGDINGDGYPALGPAFDRNNDLLFVPHEATNVPSSIGTFTRLAAALETDACLIAFRGTFITRNGCRAPWQNRLDLRLTHGTTIAGADVRLSADIINLLNMMNPEWGLTRTIPPVSPLLRTLERVPITNELLVEWAAGLLPFRDDAGNLVTPQPWSIASPESQWQAQFGVRVTLGR